MVVFESLRPLRIMISLNMLGGAIQRNSAGSMGDSGRKGGMRRRAYSDYVLALPVYPEY